MWKKTYKTGVAKSGNSLVESITLPKSKFKWGDEIIVEVKIKKTGRRWDGYKYSKPQTQAPRKSQQYTIKRINKLCDDAVRKVKGVR